MSKQKFVNNVGFWTICGVKYGGRVQSWDLAKDPFTEGKLEEHLANSNRAMSRGGFFIPNCQLSYSICRALYHQREDPLVQPIKDSLVDYMILFSTYLLYPDIVIHDFGLPTQFKKKIELFGDDELIEDTKTPEIYKGLFGSGNIKEIVDVYGWLYCDERGTSLRLDRVKDVNAGDEAMVRFSIGGG
jgi:hypothetical protein